MRTEGATPSSPKTGELVASLWRGGNLGVYYLYADGRLVSVDDASGTPGWVEQRLTPEGVERIRSEFLASGLFDPGKGPAGDQPWDFPGRSGAPTGPGTAGECYDCVRDGGRLLQRGVDGLTPEEQLLVDQLGALPASLPPTDWADPQIRAYVPTQYQVCLTAGFPRDSWSVPPDPAKVLKALPAQAAKLLGRREAEFRRYWDVTCLAVTTGEARVLASELVDAFGAPFSVDRSSFEFQADVNRQHEQRFGIRFWALLPGASWAAYFPDDQPS